MYYCYCCCSPNDATSSSTTTTTTTTTNTNESDSDNKSKPWLSRMFTSGGSMSADNDASSGHQQQTGEYSDVKHFDLKNVRKDFNRPAGHSAAPGVRVSKSGRKIR